MANERSVAVVTGAGRAEGIGFEVARQLGERGFTVIVTARREEQARARAADLRARGLDVRAERLDVADDASVRLLGDAIARELGRCDVLVNNAAGASTYGERPSMADLPRAHEVLDATLFGTWRVTQALLPLLMRSPQPRIVNVSSGAGSHADPVFGLTSGNAMGPSYAIAKAALNALTASLAHELRDTPVIVNAVCPGFTATFPGAEAMGARPVHDGAASVVWAALVGDDGPRGGFFRDGRPLGW